MMRHPEWCTQDQRCTAHHMTGGEHASHPEIWEISGGRIVATRYQTGSGAHTGGGFLEIRTVLDLPTAEAAAQQQARDLITAVFAAVNVAHKPTPGRTGKRPTVLITRGLPGCGKTTIARRWASASPHRARISRDDLRIMLHHRRRDSLAEQHITDTSHAAARTLLRQGVSVVFDETSLPDAHHQQLVDLAESEAAQPVTVDLRHVPLAVCLQRNNLRSGSDRVPDHVIRTMHARYIATVLEGKTTR